jgi:hypothetical protein
MNVCNRPECQTTAGCAYRGLRGEFCYFAGDWSAGHNKLPTMTQTPESEVLLREIRDLLKEISIKIGNNE